MRVGVIGAGVISDVYLGRLGSATGLDIVAVADIDLARARSAALRHGIPQWGAPEIVLGDRAIDIVVNLTVPAAHKEVTLAAIAAGKHVWSEKPIALTVADADEIIEAAADRGVIVGVAPDTLLGSGFTSALRALRSGEWGRPIFAQAAIQNAGPDWWHPSPEFLFARGAGPVLDMGPYYLTALAQIFGPAAEVVATGQRPQSLRTIREGDRAGERFAVEVDTTVSAIVRYAGGGHAQLLFSFDSPLRRAGFFEVTTSSATVDMPDPNRFDGSASALRVGTDAWLPVGAVEGTESRGLGVEAIARAVRGDAAVVPGPELARHVLDTLLAIERAARTGAPQRIDTVFPHSAGA